MTNEWGHTPTDEKEVTILFDYGGRKCHIYTSNQVTGNKFFKKLGNPSQKQITDGKVFSMSWEIPFEDRENLKKVLSINNFVSKFISENGK